MNYTYNTNYLIAGGGVGSGGGGSNCVTSNATYYYIGGGPWVISYSSNTNCLTAGTIYPITIPVWEAEVDGEIEFEE